jgi:hypothetical protein
MIGTTLQTPLRSSVLAALLVLPVEQVVELQRLRAAAVVATRESKTLPLLPVIVSATLLGRVALALPLAQTQQQTVIQVVTLTL